MPKRKKPRREATHLYLRGQSWYYDFVWKGIRYGPKSLGPVSREVAERQIAEIRLAVIEGRYHETPVPTVHACCLEFIRWYAPGHARTSTKRYTGILERLSQQWGDLPIDRLTTVMIEGHKRDRLKVCMPRTVNMELRVLRHLCRTMVAWGYLRESPMAEVKGVLTSEHRRRVLTTVEESRLLAACGDHLRPVVIFGIETGLRYDELIALRWRHYDRLNRTILVEKAKSRRSRTVPLTRRAMSALDARPYTEEDGSIFGYRKFDDVFKAAVTRAGLRGVTPHAMRHTYATRCLEAGIDLVVLQRWLGHSSLVQTQIYTHVSTAHEAESLARLERRTPHEAQ
jgi:integrase